MLSTITFTWQKKFMTQGVSPDFDFTAVKEVMCEVNEEKTENFPCFPLTCGRYVHQRRKDLSGGCQAGPGLKLGTPGGAKSFLRMAQIFKLYLILLSRGAKYFAAGPSPLACHRTILGLCWTSFGWKRPRGAPRTRWFDAVKRRSWPARPRSSRNWTPRAGPW